MITDEELTQLREEIKELQSKELNDVQKAVLESKVKRLNLAENMRSFETINKLWK